MPSEEELLRELNQEYRALEAGKTDEEYIDGMKKNKFYIRVVQKFMELIFCGKEDARAVLVLYNYWSYFCGFVEICLIWYACGDGSSDFPQKARLDIST